MVAAEDLVEEVDVDSVVEVDVDLVEVVVEGLVEAGVLVVDGDSKFL